MKPLTYAEFCAGAGGLGLAVEDAFRADLRWYSEFDAAPSKVMAHHWPDVPNLGDMTAIDFSKVEPVDILSGGTPCQDLSHAGRRAGMRTGTRSGLWESMREAIATIKPTYVVWENVKGAYSAGADSEMEPCAGCVGDAGNGEHLLRALGRVLGDLADLGFDAEWRGLRAADVGAPHGRFRVFLLAKKRAAAADAGRDESERRGVTEVMGGTPSPRETDREEWERFREAATYSSPGDIEWGPYERAIRQWEAMRGAAPSPTELTPKGKHRLSAAFGEWLMGWEPGWVTGVPGLTRNDQLKIIGNGVVPTQCAAALRDMLAALEEQEKEA